MTLVERLRTLRQRMEASAEGSRAKKILLGILVVIGAISFMLLGILLIGVILIASPFLSIFIILFLFCYGLFMAFSKPSS